MIINWVGNFQNGYVGEQGDSVHLCRELESLGHQVHRVPQDIWKAHCEGELNNAWSDYLPVKSDINIITKWHHFIDGSYIEKLREESGAPVFYWVWDYMDDMGLPGWHMKMVHAADLYLGNDVRNPFYKQMNNVYYFPFDVCDGEIPIYQNQEKKYDVVFTGSCIGQGHRIEWLTKINEAVKIICFSWNHEEWQKRGFTAYPAVYGEEYNKVISQAKIVIGFSVNPSTWGYWSNRVGKVLRAGGCLLYEYAPGMETAIGDAVEYFSSPEEAISKIYFLLGHDNRRKQLENKATNIGSSFTSQKRCKDLSILMDRFVKTGGKDWMY